MQMKNNDRRSIGRKKKKKKKAKPQLKVKSTKKKILKTPATSKSKPSSRITKNPSTQKRDRSVDTNKSKQPTDLLSPQPPEEKHQSIVLSPTKVLSKDAAKLKTLPIFEPWIKRDELDVRKLFETKGFTY
jgi:hypothetical protein